MSDSPSRSTAPRTLFDSRALRVRRRVLTSDPDERVHEVAMKLSRIGHDAEHGHARAGSARDDRRL
jgi:hypothetical protein